MTARGSHLLNAVLEANIENEDCWLWTGSRDTQGYGITKWEGRNRGAHRVAYELFQGEAPRWPDTLDHLCRVRHCINPSHLERVPFRDNVLRGDGPTARNARKTHCKAGHEFNSQNTSYRTRRRERVCLVCYRQYAADWRKRVQRGL